MISTRNAAEMTTELGNTDQHRPLAISRGLYTLSALCLRKGRSLLNIIVRTTAMYECPALVVVESVAVFFDRIATHALPVRSKHDWRASKLQAFLDNNPNRQPARLGALCKALDLEMSDRQARRIFKHSVGIGFREYARRRRCVAAAQQLKDTNKSIKAIAFDLGFSSAGHLARSFRGMYLLNPADFRRLLRNALLN